MNNSNDDNKMKKNISNMVNFKLIEDIINTPQEAQSIEEDNSKEKKLKKKKKIKKFSKFKKMKTQENIENDIKPFDTTQTKINSPKKWFSLLRYFTRIYSFFSVLKKYTYKIKTIRSKKINESEEKLIFEVHIIRNWMIDLQGKYWTYLKKYKNVITSFTENDPVEFIIMQSKILLDLIDKYLYNIKINTNSIDDIPEEVQKIIYNYIKKNSYFPSSYLNSFHLQRLYFDFYGGSANNNVVDSAMILCYFLISTISVQQILLNIKFIFKKLKAYENISITTKYMASILYYLERDAFFNRANTSNNYLNLINYYKCYRLPNCIIGKKNIKILLGIKKDININDFNEDEKSDVYKDLLIDDKIIDKFWEINSEVMNTFSNSLFLWSNKLAKLILNKYDKKNKK
jgi:hypothetical protein